MLEVTQLGDERTGIQSPNASLWEAYSFIKGPKVSMWHKWRNEKDTMESRSVPGLLFLCLFGSGSLSSKAAPSVSILGRRRHVVLAQQNRNYPLALKTKKYLFIIICCWDVGIVCYHSKSWLIQTQMQYCYRQSGFLLNFIPFSVIAQTKSNVPFLPIFE